MHKKISHKICLTQDSGFERVRCSLPLLHVFTLAPMGSNSKSGLFFKLIYNIFLVSHF